jgi:hypothetical protein
MGDISKGVANTRGSFQICVSIISFHIFFFLLAFLSCSSSTCQNLLCQRYETVEIITIVDTDPHHFQDPDPYQRDKLDPDSHQFADDKPKCMEYEHI